MQEEKIHFLEIYGINKFEMSLQSAFNYITNILFDKISYLVPYRYYQREILLGLEFLLKIYYMLKHNSSYSEFYFGLCREKLSQNKLTTRYKIASLIIELIISYLINKLEMYFNKIKIESKLQRTQISKFKQFYLQVFPFFYAGYEITQFGYSFLYLMKKNFMVHSISSHILKYKLIRLKSQQNQSIVQQLVSQYSIFILYLITKILDWNYSNPQDKNQQKNYQLVQPPFQKLSQERYCPICKKNFKNPTCLAVSGFVFCFACIDEFLRKYQMCPITKIKCGQNSLYKIYNQ